MATNLPVDELVEILGVREALTFAERFGGAPVYVPATDGESELSERAGPAVARKLAERYPATWLTIPRCAGLVRARRNETVRAEYAAGESAAALARKYGLTERHVWRILREAGSERQRKMFA